MESGILKPMKYIPSEDANFLRYYNKRLEENQELNPKGILMLKSDDISGEEIEKIRQEFKDFLSTATTISEEKQELAIRFDEGKVHMDLLNPIAMFATARVLTKGLEKYPGSQWTKGMLWSKVIASTMRHWFKFMAGEDIDEETGLPHIDCVASNVMFLQYYYRKHKNLDDRMKTGLE